MSLTAMFASGATLFQDGFESGALSPAWTVSGTNDSRAAISTAFGPATGQAHLVLDDSVNDAIYSVSEAILAVDVTAKKNVILSFKAKSLGNEPHPPNGHVAATRSFDGVSVSIDGGQMWRNFQSLAEVTGEWQSFTVNIGGGVGEWGEGVGPKFRIRFSVYDNSSAPIDGIAIDDIVVTADPDQRSLVELPSPLIEGTGPQTGYVQLAFAPSAPVTLTLGATTSGQLSLPPSVTIPAGASHAAFEFRVLDNSVVDLTRTFGVYAAAPEVTVSPASLTVYDDDAPIPALILPAQVVEGTSAAQATLRVNRVATVPLTMVLTAPRNEITLPDSVTVPAGAPEVSFWVSAVNDNRIDGNIVNTVTVTAPGIQTATAQTTAVDNEARNLALTLPATVSEGRTAQATVSIPGILPTALTVNVAVSPQGQVNAPASVTIPASSTSVSFDLAAADNALQDGSRTVTVTASAESFQSASKSAVVRDNDAVGYRFTGLADIVNISSPVPMTIAASDIEGNPITDASATVSLSVILPDGTSQPATPATVSLSGNGWAGNVTFPQNVPGPLRLRAVDQAGLEATSPHFDLMRVLPIVSTDLIYDAARGRLYASIPANAGNATANRLRAIDPATLQTVGDLFIGEDPALLALTSGSESLYVLRQADRSIARIDLTSFSVAQTFPLGIDPQYNVAVTASDIAAVPGQPNLLVVSQYLPTYGQPHRGVVVYDDGIPRPARMTGLGLTMIEPSADPTMVFGATTSGGFRVLRLDANGLSYLGGNTAMMPGDYPHFDLRSSGNTVYSTGGVAIDGVQLTQRGKFFTSGVGLVAPDRASNRVYFLEKNVDVSYPPTFDRIEAFDLEGFLPLRRMTLQAPAISPSGFTRCGANSFAYRTPTAIVVITSKQLVPDEAPADLSLALTATPNPVQAGTALSYRIEVKNHGPNVARSGAVSVVLSDSQNLEQIEGGAGTSQIAGQRLTIPLPDLAVNQTHVVTMRTRPQSAGPLTCAASVTAAATDPLQANNTATDFLSVTYSPLVLDEVKSVRLPANNVVYDPTRNVFWATLWSILAYPAYQNSIVSIDPATGAVSPPLPVGATVASKCMALSSNGRYLYIGLSDVREVHRVDLTDFTSTRIPLNDAASTGANYARALAALEGDGTSFLVSDYANGNIAVFDDTVRRPGRGGASNARIIQQTSAPDVFVSHADYSYPLTKFRVTASGVTNLATATNLLSSGDSEIRAAGDTILTSGGRVLNSATFSFTLDLKSGGLPCLDVANNRGYLLNVSDRIVRSFDLTSGQSEGTFQLPGTNTTAYTSCYRWGVDGLAAQSSDGKFFIWRWSKAVPRDADQNGDRIADAWALKYFGQVAIDPSADDDRDGIANALEYLTGTSPVTGDAHPLRAAITKLGSDQQLHLTFSRRVGVASDLYSYEVSSDLRQWLPASGVIETVAGTTIADGIQLQVIDAAIPGPLGSQGFARLRWLGPE